MDQTMTHPLFLEVLFVLFYRDNKIIRIYSVAPSVISNEVRNPFLFA